METSNTLIRNDKLAVILKLVGGLVCENISMEEFQLGVRKQLEKLEKEHKNVNNQRQGKV